MVHDVAHELVRPARNQQVHVLVAAQQLVDLAVKLRLQEAARGKPRLNHGRVYHVKQHAVGVGGLAPALQHGAVAALDAQRANLHQRVRPRLEDHAYHANGARHAPELQPLVKLSVEKDPAHRVGKLLQLPKALDAVAKLRLVVAQPLLDGLCNAGLGRGRHVLLVCREDALGVCLQRLRYELERTVALLQRGRRHRGRLELHPVDAFPHVHVASSCGAGRAAAVPRSCGVVLQSVPRLPACAARVNNMVPLGRGTGAAAWRAAALVGAF